MELFRIKLNFAAAIICVLIGKSVHGKYFEEVASLKASQRNALNQFRTLVMDSLPHDYMKEDFYLARFLRAKDFRIRDAERMLNEALEWRRLNNMDEVDKEDFSEFLDDFPLYFDGVDKQGRVIMEAHFGEWPMRTAVVAGKLRKLNRYGVKAIDDATKKVRELQTSGQNITQWVMLLNMEGFSIAESACPSCLPYYLNFVSSYEKYYPFSLADIVFVNTPEAFEIVMNLIRPLMNIQTRKIMKIFGASEAQWKPYVQEHFSASEIADWFGGNKVRKATSL